MTKTYLQMELMNCGCTFHKFYKKHLKWYKTLAIKFQKMTFFDN